MQAQSIFGVPDRAVFRGRQSRRRDGKGRGGHSARSAVVTFIPQKIAAPPVPGITMDFATAWRPQHLRHGAPWKVTR